MPVLRFRCAGLALGRQNPNECEDKPDDACDPGEQTDQERAVPSDGACVGAVRRKSQDESENVRNGDNQQKRAGDQ